MRFHAQIEPSLLPAHRDPSFFFGFLHQVQVQVQVQVHAIHEYSCTGEAGSVDLTSVKLLNTTMDVAMDSAERERRTMPTTTAVTCITLKVVVELIFCPRC